MKTVHCFKVIVVLSIFIFLVNSCETTSSSSTVKSQWKTKSSLVKINTRPGVNLKFILIEPPEPKANVILFAGGHGILKLSSAYSMGWGENNFLVRTRNKFASYGFTVVVVDAPSDKRKPQDMYWFRNKMDHIIDIEHVIKYLNNRNSLPVWLVGTSRGTISALCIANNTRQPIDGLILTSSMNIVADLPKFNIHVPSLVVHHRQDGCEHCRPDYAELTYERLSEYSPVTELKYYVGGSQPVSSPCNAKSQHGFYGIESEVVHDICLFIKSNNQI